MKPPAFLFLAITANLFFSCMLMESAVKEVPIIVKSNTGDKSEAPQPRTDSGITRTSGIASLLKYNVECGIPSLLQNVLTTIAAENLSSTDYGRVLEYITNIILTNIYSESNIAMHVVYPVETNLYTKIIRAANNNIYTAPPYTSDDYLEYVLPFFSLLDNNNPVDVDYKKVLRDLLSAQDKNWKGVLSYYFAGIVYERLAQIDKTANIDYDNAALEQYSKAVTVSPECYPAAVAQAQLLYKRGNSEQAVSLLNDLINSSYSYLSVKKPLAKMYYDMNDFTSAEKLIDEILVNDNDTYSPSYYEYYFMKASILYTNRQFRDAQNILDKYNAEKNNDIQFALLHGKILADGFHNYTDAITYFETLLQKDDANKEALLYKAKIFLESLNTAERETGSRIMNELLAAADAPVEVYRLAVTNAIQMQDWKNARLFIEHILLLQSSETDLLDAYTIAKNSGNPNRALQFASELVNKYPNLNRYRTLYIEALINSGGAGNTEAAFTQIDTYLKNENNNNVRSSLFYFRSIIQKIEEARLEDLRLALFENPRNLDALLSLFDIYHKKNDSARAAFYLKQIQSISPENKTGQTR